MRKWTRRSFITVGLLTGGALVVGVALRPGHRATKLAPLVTVDGEHLVNAWVKIGSDNTVTAIVPHAEMGQGVHTSLAQMLADELDADWEHVRVLEAPAHEEYANYALAKGFALGNINVPRVLMPTVDGAFLTITQAIDLQITGGSTSVRATGLHGMRVAGAAARAMLVDAAAAAWGVPASEVKSDRGFLTHHARPRRAPYADFAAAAADLTPPAKPKLKRPAEFTLMGRSLARLDVPAKVNGTASFGMDVALDGMLHASVKASPVFGGKVERVSAGIAEAMPGVHQVVHLEDAVAVVAEGYWQAQQALAKVKVQFDDAPARETSQEQIFAQFANDLDRAAASGDFDFDREVGDVERAFPDAAHVVEAEYRVPYLAHACMEPLNCTAWVHEGRAELWTGTQNPLGFRAAVAEALDLDEAKVAVHNQYLGGGFGRRSNPDYAVQAARIADYVGAPVKLIWSREEDIRQDRYRPAVLSRFRGALNVVGKPVAWTNYYVEKHEPKDAPLIPYSVPNQSIGYLDSPTHVPFGPWRSVDQSQHGFFTESFIDELATAAGQDPYLYRRELLAAAPRLRKVLETAADQAGWGTALPEGKGRGIALQQSFGSIVAHVVEIVVSARRLKVERVVCAVDCGYAVNPDGLIAQMEGSVIFGLTAALYGEITIEKGAVKQSNFHDYRMLRMDETPVIETVIINSGEALGGAGEPGVPGIAPALTNAIFDATRTRVRELPVSKHGFGLLSTGIDKVV